MNFSTYSTKIKINLLVSIFNAGSGHPGGSLSCVDIITFLYVEKKRESDRIRIILSKGHAAPTLYAAAAVFGECPFEAPLTLRKLGSRFQGHPDVRMTPWVEASTGSLGQGFSVGIGMAMGFRHQQDPSRVYIVLGDGELQEGEVWEGAMCASHHKLDNLCAIVDYNKLQSDDLNANIMGLEPLRSKWEAFNWHVLEIDGHDFEQIEQAFATAKEIKDKPTVIIAHTIKGNGISFMAGVPAWHGSVKLRPEELEQALDDLGVHPMEISKYINGSI